MEVFIFLAWPKGLTIFVYHRKYVTQLIEGESSILISFRGCLEVVERCQKRLH